MADLKNTPQAALDDCWNRIGVHGDQSCAELLRHIHCRNCPVFSAAARTLLDVPAPAGFRQTATEHFARPAQAERGHVASADMQSAIVFRLRAEWYAIRTAVCLTLVVAPPIKSGISNPWRSISLATWTISSSDGVMSPDSPTMSHPCSTAASTASPSTSIRG